MQQKAANGFLPPTMLCGYTGWNIASTLRTALSEKKRFTLKENKCAFMDIFSALAHKWATFCTFSVCDTTVCLWWNAELYFLTWFGFCILRMYQHGSLVNNIPQIYLVDGSDPFSTNANIVCVDFCFFFYWYAVFFVLVVWWMAAAVEMLLTCLKSTTEIGLVKIQAINNKFKIEVWWSYEASHCFRL